MEENKNSNGIFAWILGALGVGAAGTAALSIPKYGIWIAVAILVLAVLIFGSYLLILKLRARRQSRNFEGAVQMQTSTASKSISDPNRRAALDKLRQKFQSGLNEFKSRGKDFYRLPWYVIIGEPGSGKSEAIRRSGIDFPPGLRDELQGSGGTINMDWWFTNRSVILDTAGSMVFSEQAVNDNPEWKEFLRLLKRARPHCPVNGLFLVLSAESLIKDSSDKIAYKASRLAQQLDLIQRTLDVRFPVYLLVTKCDLLTGFNEFFDNIDDPLLQHQIFGWSNPEELDTPFHPELVENHLKTVADRLRRRRLALVRENSVPVKYGDTQFFPAGYQAGALTKRRLDEVDSLFALPESVLRLSPRLRRYLETIFVAGEWSAKPVFLRGIYFTSSMRGGKALDEATALALGVPVDQLPEDRQWEKNRSFFMRDLFMEKVFRESGLVTRATNTLKLVRQRRRLIFGTATVALALLLTFSYMAYRSLSRSVLAELPYWQVGATNWVSNDLPFSIWQPSVVRSSADDPFHFIYQGEDPMPGIPGVSVAEYQLKLRQLASQPLEINWVFRPMMWVKGDENVNRKQAQELVFEGGVLRPLIYFSRQKMKRPNDPVVEPQALARQREALLSLIGIEADALSAGEGIPQPGTNDSSIRYLQSFESYLADADLTPNTNLVESFRWTFNSSAKAIHWPPADLLGGNSLGENPAIRQGLENFKLANQGAQNAIEGEVEMVNTYADALDNYRKQELTWLQLSRDWCQAIAPGADLEIAYDAVSQRAASLAKCTNYFGAPGTALAPHYQALEQAAVGASASAFRDITAGLPDAMRTHGLFMEINQKIRDFASVSAQRVRAGYLQRTSFTQLVDSNLLVGAAGEPPAYAKRWALFRRACSVADYANFRGVDEVGHLSDHVSQFRQALDSYRNDLNKYDGPLSDKVIAVCRQIAGDAELKGIAQLQEAYAREAAVQTARAFAFSSWSQQYVEAASNLMTSVGADLTSANSSVETARFQPVSRALLQASADCYAKLEFPLLLDGDPAISSMQPAEIQVARNFSELMISLWNRNEFIAPLSQDDRAQEVFLQKKFERIDAVARALTDGQGNVAKLQVNFVPPREGTEDEIIRVYRQADVLIGPADSGWLELAQHIGQGGFPVFRDSSPVLSDGLDLKFRKLANDSNAISALHEGSWFLVRMIQKGTVISSDGMVWELPVALQDSTQGISGKANFEIHTANPLPQAADWPRH